MRLLVGRHGVRAWASCVPRFMRSWPGLRRYYWQASDLEAARRKADEWLAVFNRLEGNE